MRKIYLLLVVLVITRIYGHAQNLVNNPGFETITGSCSFAGYSSLVNWENPDPSDTCSTPDWFATCVLSPFTKAPNTQLGYQVPHGGTAYAGFISYDQTTANYREYVEGSLSSPMQAGYKYDVSFYISLANKSPISADKLGIYFSNTLYSFTANNCTNVAPLPATPQIDTTFTLLDTANWVQLVFQYTATGGEQYFTVGNFHNNSTTNTSAAPGGPSITTPFAYYFVDDFTISLADSTVDTTGDTTNPEGIANTWYNSKALDVYPNPANELIHIDCPGSQQISMINNLGLTVYDKKTKGNETIIETANLPKGIYILRVQTGSGVLVRKIEVFR